MDVLALLQAIIGFPNNGLSPNLPDAPILYIFNQEKTTCRIVAEATGFERLQADLVNN